MYRGIYPDSGYFIYHYIHILRITYTYIYNYIHSYIYIYTYIHVVMYIYIHIHIYIYIYLDIHIHTQIEIPNSQPLVRPGRPCCSVQVAELATPTQLSGGELVRALRGLLKGWLVDVNRDLYICLDLLRDLYF